MLIFGSFCGGCGFWEVEGRGLHNLRDRHGRSFYVQRLEIVHVVIMFWGKLEETSFNLTFESSTFIMYKSNITETIINIAQHKFLGSLSHLPHPSLLHLLPKVNQG